MRKHNFQLETDDILKGLGGARPRLLLHCCCGPCASYVISYLVDYFDVTALFFNPNIRPAAEHEKRLLSMRALLSKLPETVPLIACDCGGEAFDAIAAVSEHEAEGGARCAECFKLRLGETAKRAKIGGFDYFCTTLTVSPHKDEALINGLGTALARERGLLWLPSDFKKRGGYAQSVNLSAEYGLYRQSYCGC